MWGEIRLQTVRLKNDKKLGKLGQNLLTDIRKLETCGELKKSPGYSKTNENYRVGMYI
jgi:hypothetical protein